MVHEHVIKSGKFKLKKETFSHPNETVNPVLEVKRVQPKVKQYVIRFQRPTVPRDNLSANTHELISAESMARLNTLG